MDNNNPNDLSAVIDGLFANEITKFTTQDGFEVQFRRAGIVQLGKATDFFRTLMESAPVEKVKQLIDLIATEQQQLLSDGKSVHDLSLNATQMIQKGLANQSLLLEIFGVMSAKLPEFCSYFSNVTTAQYEDMSLDEQLVIAAGVFAVNYGFFTQSLPPIIKSVVRGLKSKQIGSNENKGKLEAKSVTKKNP